MGEALGFDLGLDVSYGLHIVQSEHSFQDAFPSQFTKVQSFLDFDFIDLLHILRPERFKGRFELVVEWHLSCHAKHLQFVVLVLCFDLQLLLAKTEYQVKQFLWIFDCWKHPDGELACLDQLLNLLI